MKINLSILIFLLNVSYMVSTVYQIETIDDFYNLASKIVAGDVIELKEGKYGGKNMHINNLKGTKEKPITVRPVKGAKVVFDGTGLIDGRYAQFIQFAYSSYLNIEGPIEIVNSPYRGLYILDCDHVTIDGIIAHDLVQNGIVVSGDYITVKNCEVYNTCLLNKDENERKTTGNNWGWDQAMSCFSKDYIRGDVSTNVIFENNYIHDNWGEGLDFLMCAYSKAINNTIVNSYSCSLYSDSSTDITIDRNIIKVTTDKFNGLDGRANCIGFSAESGNRRDTENVFITNNLMTGCRIAIGYYSMGMSYTYSNFHILHNTMWHVDEPILFNQDQNSKHGQNYIMNNLLYISGSQRNFWAYLLTDSDRWEKLRNVEIFNDNVPDTQYLFEAKCNFNQEDLPINCFYPSAKGLLLKEGKDVREFVETDYLGCKLFSRPSIGMFGSNEKCEDILSPHIETFIFKIHCNTVYGENAVLVGSEPYLNWDPFKGKKMTWSEGNIYKLKVEPDNAKHISEFKVIKRSNDNVVWERRPGNENRKFDAIDSILKVKSGNWDDYDSSKEEFYVDLGDFEV